MRELLDFVLNGYVLLIGCALRCIIILIWTAVQFEGGDGEVISVDCEQLGRGEGGQRFDAGAGV